MMIWILTAFLLGVAAVLGYFQGAVRLLVSLVGLFLGALLAFPLVPLLKPVVGWVGIKHPVWSWVWPPIWVFLLVLLVFVGLAFFVQRKVDLYFKYSADDLARLRWERINKSLGLCAGVVMGSAWLFLIGLIVYVTGNFTIQVTTDDTVSGLLRFVTQARRDLNATGLEKGVAAFDPMPAKYNQASDIIGLIYQNPILVSRLSQYPPFLTMRERTEFQEMTTDAEFNNLLQAKGDFVEIAKHPKVQAVLYNGEILQELLQQDLKDLRVHLETGQSPKYADEKILGRWHLDLYATLAQERKKNPNIPASQMARVKKVMSEVMKSITFTATTDNKVTLQVEVSEAFKQAQAAAQAAANAAAAPPDGAPSMPPELAERYGRRPSGGPVPPVGGRPPQLARPPATRNPATPAPRPAGSNEQPTQPIFSAQGSWQREGEKYQIKLQDERGKEETVTVTADDERLTMATQAPPMTLVFVKAE